MLRVGILMGGKSTEREISLVTGKAIVENLDKQKYEVIPIEIEDFSVLALYVGKIDLMFIALHGTYGEDGVVQGMLEGLGIAYTGSEILASALAMNKDISAQIYRMCGLKVPPYILCDQLMWKQHHSYILAQAENAIGFPAVIKPIDQGSAVGVSIVKNKNELNEVVSNTILRFPRLMIQKCIKGTEVTCGVLERDKVPFALPPTRIVANFNEFYDYTSKYQSGGSTHICPADLDEKLNKKIQAVALQAHQTLGCRGMSRTDMFVDEENQIWILETNTIPGMTPTSLLPEAAQKAGISFSEMLDLIVQASL